MNSRLSGEGEEVEGAAISPGPKEKWNYVRVASPAMRFPREDQFPLRLPDRTTSLGDWDLVAPGNLAPYRLMPRPFRGGSSSSAEFNNV